MRHFFREWQEASHATPGRRRYHNITIWVVLAIGVWNLAVPVWVCPVAVIADWVLYAFLVRKWIRGDLLSAYRAEHPADPAEEDAPLAMASASAMISSPEDLLWLLDRSENKGYFTGIDASGWEDSTWILNAFYELSIHGEVPSHDELRRSRIASGEEEPLIINGFNLGLATTNSGGGLGYHARPRPLTGSDVPGQRYWTASLSRSRADGPPPCFRWFPVRSFPANIQPPGEGSMGEEDFAELIRVLSEHSPWPLCSMYFADVFNTSIDPLKEAVYEARLRDLPMIIADKASERQAFTPANIWPLDRSWLVYTDYDLWATKVSGSTELINALRENTLLETLDWALNQESQNSRPAA